MLVEKDAASHDFFDLYSEYVNKEALEGLGDFKVEEQMINTVRYVDDLVLLANEETILQSTLIS